MPLIFLPGKLHKCRIWVGISARIDSCKAPLVGNCRDSRMISFFQAFLDLFQSFCPVIGKSKIPDPAFFLQVFQNVHDLFHQFLLIISVKPVKIDPICSQCAAAFIQICTDIFPVHSATRRIFKGIMRTLGSHDHFPCRSTVFQPFSNDLLTAVSVAFQPLAVHIGCINKISASPYKCIQHLETFFLI